MFFKKEAKRELNTMERFDVSNTYFRPALQTFTLCLGQEIQCSVHPKPTKTLPVAAVHVEYLVSSGHFRIIGVLGPDFRQGLGIFLFTTASRTALGSTQPPIQWVTGSLSLEVKRPGSEAEHSPPSSAEVKNEWSYTSTRQYVFMAWCLVKRRDNFTFTLPY
jgi:hypothetical protein